ncbi:MAG: tRNA (adenosine(37)-N6)-threonylcarbamoyltransferase complex ATPase subunit type 1 TsaE [Candidatus Levybacteria bacterium RIFCSPLOWO2_01_FULL_39_24]|nr:MAG: tRNA (adenosine(37)-N6)-threonylcarbamoyltransferase complex ATPase subunit type 1 TsaE [Candidatus Levybacteria bacterium RIFCSPHIGHO2_01_FULL_40_16]OGH28646.1 MAG: tRNA (adenosine(37)-N6)-threonylcarbamoyltransferase complex ATPase subunit type 1 TsaE [Candidatus Levybacteria bacterium RIFCSPHIGHO2_12_FULL_39_9]OGH46040.1 MAG: tRNA (adenosine(37)-N6)-threonylcarbamoyltransferase complex ATPase subunit type 1 TsaE [Candidatus Levybacteria bacterium RIFCSPLOWO2_01_FULL_39_24]
MKEKVFVTNNFEETQKLGENFARSLLASPQGETSNVITLYGELGSGKTTFVQGLAAGLGIKNRIISPTFIIVRSYKLRIKDKGLMINDFYHIDLYRVESERDLEGLGIEEIVNNKNNIVVIEWAEKLKKYLPQKRIDIKFSYEKDNIRKIMFGSSNQ